MAAERLRLRIVEGAAISLADRGARRGDDDGLTHSFSPALWMGCRIRHIPRTISARGGVP